jgi:hypothetical protein
VDFDSAIPRFESWPLTKPLFRTCQRFRLASGKGSTYLTLWTVQSPEAFETPEYKSDWGFFEWAPYVTDWSRDVFDGRFAPKAAFAVSLKGSLRVVSCDGMSEEAACAARTVIAKSHPELLWLPVIGLDRSCPMIGLQPLSELVSSRKSKQGRARQAHEAIYLPMSDVFAAERSRVGIRPRTGCGQSCPVTACLCAGSFCGPSCLSSSGSLAKSTAICRASSSVMIPVCPAMFGSARP